MGINPTQSNFKSFTFDGENSRNYGVYITGQGVFNAPERNVEMIEIPNRNGAYALDKGNFNNIEVTYPAGIFADTEADFAQAVSDLRNFLCSRVGYVRLEDDYNTGEYRMAIYKSGLEVSHDMLIVGEFDIVFECKPQRFLKSGETATAITSGGTITNPTLFDARPQLQVKGYGTIKLGGAEIVVSSTSLGNIIIGKSVAFSIQNALSATRRQTIDTDLLASGNGFVLNGKKLTMDIPFSSTNGNLVQFEVSNMVNCSASATYNQTIGTIQITVNDIQFSKGVYLLHTASLTLTWKQSQDATASSGTITIDTEYDVPDYPDYISHYTVFTGQRWNCVLDCPIIIGNSTQTLSDISSVIDLEIGEAYVDTLGGPVSINNSVSIPAELPVLPSGVTIITYNNTFTSFKVVPRWWQV